ncbi:MAG: DUF881 domain-containing protein [Arachnia sp.]
MSLLTDLQANALEPEYRSTGTRHKSSPLLLAATLALLAALIAIAVVSTTRSSEELDSERTDLLERVTTTVERVEVQEAELAALELEIRDLGAAQINDPALAASLAALDPLVGMVPVTGPGIIIEVTDATDSSDTDGVVFDSDLSRLVNGLRQAGAEAVAINGRRVTSLTPIRTAGSAITVDYVSLSPPYRVEAIGDPATMSARFARTSAAAWWKYISDNFGIGFSIREADEPLTLPADPGMELRRAEK